MAATGAARLELGPCMEVLETVSAHPEQLLSVQEGLASEFSLLTKSLYDLHKSELVLKVGSPLKELVIENFDEEQIWQQLELQNRAVLGYFTRAVTKTLKDKDLCLVQPPDEEASETEESVEEEEEDILEDPELNTDREAEAGKARDPKPNGRKSVRKTRMEKFSDDDSDMDFDIDKLEKQSKPTANKKAAVKPAEKSIVDDRFFKLSEMEAFLEATEKEEGGKDEDEVDYFEDILSDDDDDDDEEEFHIEKTKRKVAKSSRDLQYKDYFDPVDNQEEMDRQPEDENEDSVVDDENEEDVEEGDGNEEEMIEDEEEDDDDDDAMEETEESKKAKEAFKRVTFDLSDDSEGEEVGDILGGKKKPQDLEPSEAKSSFEKREEKMAERIQTLQKQMLGEKSWQLSGEVTAQKRPENSLLAETVLFDHASRMAPIITEETTLQLDDIIKQRIKDQVWDDVVRKEKPKENAFEYKKRLTLDHEKSKQSLAEIYEQEYLKLNQKKVEEENPKHLEIQKIMDTLFLKLDALSNFHFIPKPPVPEIKVVSNLPAISMEEVAPVSVSDAALLAPEEVKEKNKAGDLKTNAEKSATDKRRERRKKKAVKRLKIKAKEKRQQLAEKARAEKGKTLSKEAAAANLKKLAKEGKATVLKDEGKDKALKSSQAFFSQLQDQVKLQIKGAKSAQKKPNKKHELSAHKLKL